VAPQSTLETETMSNYALRLPESLKQAAQRIAGTNKVDNKAPIVGDEWTKSVKKRSA